jgi:uridine monophosphate synthetase
MQLHSLIHKLYEIGAVKFGSFTLKSGIVSPIYIDLRVTISDPQLLVAIGKAMLEQVKNCSFELVCGVPYTALPIATAMSIQQKIPMILRRKEKKEYGTGKRIEGIFSKGQKCLIVEDVVTSGKSVLETAASLQEEELVIKDVVVLVDREQGGARALAEQGYKLHSVCSITSIVNTLLEERKINAATASSVLEFIQNNQTYAG